MELSLCKRSPGPPGKLRSPLGPSGTLGARPRDTSETPLRPPSTTLGPPGDAPGIAGNPRGPPQITKVTIAQKNYSARSARLLHPSPVVATHHPKDSPGPFYCVYYKNRAPFGPPAPGLRTGFTPTPWPLVPWLYIDADYT